MLVTADGAAWIWRLVADLFPCRVQIIDGYHASQQAAALARTRFPDDPQQALRWQEPLKDYLWQGECWQLLEQARSADLPASYFQEHQRPMDYPAFGAQGDPIDSGTTESAVKQFKHRFGGSGMRWSRAGLDHIVVLRSAGMEGSFDQRWAAA